MGTRQCKTLPPPFLAHTRSSFTGKKIVDLIPLTSRSFKIFSDPGLVVRGTPQDKRLRESVTSLPSLLVSEGALNS